MTKDYAIALIGDYTIELESDAITPQLYAVRVGNVLVDLVKYGTAWDEGIANAFELAAEACYMIAPYEDTAQEWLYRISDRYEDLRP